MSQLRSDLDAVQRFLAAHRRSQKGRAFEACLDVQAQSFIAKVKQIGVEMADAADLINVVEEGPWGARQKQEIVQAISAQVALGPSSRGSKSNGTQSISNLDSYLVGSLWRKLQEATCPDAAKMHAFASFFFAPVSESATPANRVENT